MCSSKKSATHMRKLENVTHSKQENELTGTDQEMMETADIDIKTAIMDMSKQSGTERKMSINIIRREVENTTKQNEPKSNSRFEECNI